MLRRESRACAHEEKGSRKKKGGEALPASLTGTAGGPNGTIHLALGGADCSARDDGPVVTGFQIAAVVAGRLK
jgi:hypothetical protein